MQKLAPSQLYRDCDHKLLDFETTASVTDMGGYIGQDRAIDAVRFGIGMQRPRYNLYLSGPHGLGKYSVVRHYLESHAYERATPPDWCYVNNFDDPRRPLALDFAASEGRQFRDDMANLIDDLTAAIPAAFEDESFNDRVQSLEDAYNKDHEQQMQALEQEAESRGIKLFRTPNGYALAPMRDGQVLRPDDFDKLSKKEQEQAGKDVSALQEKLDTIYRHLPQLRKQLRDELRELGRETANRVLSHFLQELYERYQHNNKAYAWLQSLHHDALDNYTLFHDNETEMPQQQAKQKPELNRYQVNLFVDNSEQHGAPIIYEDHPSYDRLLGTIEHISYYGTLVTDFTQVKSGSLHCANGGYLIVDADKLLTEPYAWEGLKRTLRAAHVNIESLGKSLGLISTQSLEPEAIPLNIKIVLIGDRYLYYLLSEYDPDFSELFKVVADFDTRMPRSEDNTRLYASLLASMARQEELLPLSREAVARTIEHSSRLVGDQQKLSMHMGHLLDLLCEADHWAREAKRELIEKQHIQQAIDAQIRRQDRIRENTQEAILRDIVLIDTKGERIGQVNGLSVIQLGQYAFAQPSRITATARMGEGGVIDIEREVELGGPLHSKGVLTLAAFLASRYAQDHPLAMSATVVFEQSYGEIDGDSASTGELCALLSVLAKAPVKQALAITGSVNQQGEVQAIGGVNEKVEGFFDICHARGLTGEQGVIIPASNVHDLMLKQEVVEAVEQGKFHLYSVSHVDEAIHLLTGVEVGTIDNDGKYPEGSLNRRINDYLLELAHLRHVFEGKKDKAEEEGNETDEE